MHWRGWAHCRASTARSRVTNVGLLQQVSPSERCLTVLCAKCQHTNKSLAPGGLSQTSIDWNCVRRLAERQGVSTLVWRALTTRRPDGAPPDVLAALRLRSHTIAANNLLLILDLTQILFLFAANGIDVLPWKGPALAAEVYGDPGLREFRDLDLLVAEADVVAARKLLESIGYKRAYDASQSQDRLLHRYGHEEQLVRDGQLVELHWAIAKRVHAVPFDFKSLWARRRMVKVGPYSVPTLGPEDLFLTLCVHGTSHAWQRLIWVCDIAELLRRRPDMDWDLLLSETRRLNCGRMLRVALALADGLLDAPLPLEVRKHVEADETAVRLATELSASMFREERARATFVSFHLGIRETLRAKLAFAARALLQLAPEDWTTVSLPDFAFPLYYIVRPIRLMKAYGVPFLLQRH